MPVKRILLRGISTSPSDRMIEDGGCAESLNVFKLHEEIAPAQMGRTYSIDVPEGYTPVYIGFVYFYMNSNLEVGYFTNQGQTFNTLFTAGSQIMDVQKVGNTYIFADYLHNIYYVLKKDGLPVYLGNHIPEVTLKPAIHFSDHTGWSARINTWTGDVVSDMQLTQSLWELLLAHKDSNKDKIYTVSSALWACANSIISTNRSRGYFSAPFLLRYALRLYDGSYIYQSVPILIGANDASRVFQLTQELGTQKPTASIPNEAFWATFNIGTPDFSDWKDIVKGIDIFYSEDIYMPNLYSQIESVSTDSGSLVFRMEGEGETNLASLEEELLKKSVFFLWKSYDIDNLPSGATALTPVSQDDLLTATTLPDDERSMDIVGPLNGAMTYNSRYIMKGAEITLTKGYQWWPAVGSYTGTQVGLAWYFFVKDEDGMTRIVDAVSAALSPEEPKSYIIYPNPNCYKAVVVIEGTAYEFPMKEHPRLNCAYWFGGFGDLTGTTASTIPTTFSRTYAAPNKVYASAVRNPFVFHNSGKLTMSGDVMGVATITKALSEGQYGQHDLYVFTTTGIWTVAVSALGEFTSVHPLSLEVAESPDSITQLDEAVYFVSRSGIKMLSGAGIEDIGPYLKGGPIGLSDDEKALFVGEYANIKDMVYDSDEYPSLASYKALWDAVGRRLLIPSEDYGTMLTYYADSGTWHNYADENGWKAQFAIPSEDGYYISFTRSNDDAVETVVRYVGFNNWYTFHEPSDMRTRGLIITRPFDLGEPDVRKIIKGIRIRGKYNKTYTKTEGGLTKTLKTVSYILEGSMDGHNWGILSSLGDASYKFFRLLIVADLRGDERISWIDVEFDTRFTDKLR